MADDEKTPSFKAFVGIDFGTDGSGIAYALPDGSAYIHNMWGDSEATKKPKTSVLFDKQNGVIRVGSGAQDMYLGAKADQGWKLFERFKMKLYEQPGTKSEIKQAESKFDFVDELKQEIATTNDKNIREASSKVFIAELQHLKEHAFNFINTHLKKKAGLKGDKKNGWPEVQFFLTVPAIWSDKAKDKMSQWAIKAGLIDGKIPCQLQIVYEPDCASLSIQHAIIRTINGDEKNQNENGVGEKKKKRKRKKAMEKLIPKIKINVPFRKGDKYILLDIGGGTCDVACHEIIDKFAIAEVIHPTGGPWGGTHIDERFTTLLGELFSNILLDIFQIDEEDGRHSYLKFLNYFLNESKLNYFAKYNEFIGEPPLYHDIQMPANFVNFLVAQYTKDWKRIHTCDEDGMTKGLNDLNEHLKQKAQKYSKGKKPPKPQRKAFVEGTNDNEASDSDSEMINFNDKYKNRDWVIKIIEVDEDDEGDDEEYDEDYLLSMHNDVWEMMFSVIIKPIIKHCKDILASVYMKDTKYIFLVGGFANSQYFQLRMRQEFKDFKDLQIVTPGLPGLCIVDGAARYGLNKNFMKIRRLAKTYGIKGALPKYSFKKHDLEQFPAGFVEKNTRYNDEKKMEYIGGCFSALVRKGVAVRINDKPIVQKYSKARKDQRNAEIVIYSSTKEKPMSISPDEAEKLGDFVVDLPKQDKGVMVEFTFSSNLLTVYAYPEGEPNKKVRKRVEYL